MSISLPTSFSSGHALPFSTTPKFKGEEGEPSRRAEKRPLEETGESSEQAAKRLQLEEHGADTFRASLDECGTPEQPAQPPVQDPNVHMLDPKFYQPLMERHAKALLADAVRQYTGIKTREPEKLRNAYFWISRLLKNGADPNSTPPEVPVINRALNNGKFELANKMRTHGAHVAPQNITMGIREHMFKLVKLRDREFPDNTIDAAIDRTTPCLNLPGMNLALPEVTAPQPSSRTLLHWAARAGHAPLTRTILNAGVPVDIRSEQGTPLEEVLGNINRGSAQYPVGNAVGAADALIAAGADVNRRDALGNSLLSRVLDKIGYFWADSISFANSLILAGANVNTPMRLTQKTPLHQLVAMKDDFLLDTLLLKGADVNAKMVTGITPLIQAIKAKHVDIVESLLEDPNVDANLADNEGRTPLSYAAELEATPDGGTIVEKLLDKGANPFIVGKNGKTPLIYAIENNQEKNVQALVLKNPVPAGLSSHASYPWALVNQADGNGVKPLVWALTADFPNASIIKLLETYTEDPH